MILNVQNIHKSYGRKEAAVHVLKGIDLAVEAGKFLAIVGPSGAGKSTLLHILGGLDHPDQGNVYFDGTDLYALDDVQRAKARNIKIGFVFQFYHLLPEFTALENVLLPVLIKEDTAQIKPFREKGRFLLEQVGLKERVAHHPQQLSGGEQQRVAIARALINEPQIVFCDEPTGNLDSQTGSEIIQLLSQLNQKNKQTLVIVTHDENIARQSDQVVHMRDGKVV